MFVGLFKRHHDTSAKLLACPNLHASYAARCSVRAISKITAYSALESATMPRPA